MSDILRRVQPVSPHFVRVREAPRQDENSKRRQGTRRGPDIEADTVAEEEDNHDAESKRIDVRI